MIKKLLSVVLMFTLVAVASGTLLTTNIAMAASITSFSDTLSTVKASTVANHTIVFTTPTGVASGQTIILTFDNSTSINVSMDFTDIDVLDGASQITLAAAPSGATAGVVRTSGTVITFTNGTTAIIAGHAITFKIGTNATNQSTGVRQITNGTAGTTTLAIAGTFTDTGTLAIPVVANDVVTVSATVSPTISFSLSSNSVSLGTLSTGAAGTGSHTLVSATNAPGGYAISYNGPTLTSGANTLAAYSNGASSPGTGGFGINLVANTTPSIGSAITTTAGTCAAATGYGTANQYNFVASTSTTITNVTAPANCTFTASYVANISAVTPAGSYTSAITYVDTGTF